MAPNVTPLSTPPNNTAPSLRTRRKVALAIGLGTGAFSAFTAMRKDAVPDLLWPLRAAGFLLNGENPYVMMPGWSGAPPPFDLPLFYPLTTVLAVAPLAHLPTWLATGLFFGISSALLAFVITREEFWRLHIFASAPFVVAATLGQLSPLVLCTAFLPWGGVLATLKPNLGLAILARNPSRSILLGCAAFGVVSLLVDPWWPVHWLHNLRGELGESAVHPIPLLQPGGFLLLLSLLALRRPNGRLLAVMSLVPQLIYFYDQLPLWLVAESRRQSLALTASSQLAMVLWWVFADPGDRVIGSAHHFVMALIYLPALVIVLMNLRTDWKGRNEKRASGVS